MSVMLPEYYGLVPLAVIVSSVTIVMQGSAVMEARKLYKVPYPNMYATIIEVDGKEYTNAKDPESAKLFNCAQRGHQNALELHYFLLVLTVLGGLASPIVASASLILATIGMREYARQYRCAGPENRNNKLALLKYIGLLGLFGINVYLAFQLFTR